MSGNSISEDTEMEFNGKNFKQREDNVSSELLPGTRRPQTNNTMEYILNLWASLF